MSLIEQIAAACGKAKKTSSGWQCCCPAHADNQPSLSLAESDDKVLYHCKAGCTQESVRAAIEGLGFHLNGNFGAIPETKIYYTYYDALGAPIHRKEKFLPSKKMFIQHYLDGQWHYKIGPNPPILYHLKELRAAIAQNSPVAIAEGEKDCDRVTKELGIVCTTNLTGAAEKFDKYLPEFKGANVSIFYDDDPPGIKRRDLIAKSLIGVASKITIIHCGKKDISDFFDAGGVKSELKPEAVKLPESLLLYGGEWLNKQYAVEPLIEGLFDRADKVVIIGKSKTRKSFFALQLLLSCVTGKSFLGFEIYQKRKALLIQYEIKEAHFHGRLERMCDAMGILPSELGRNLAIINARGKDLNHAQVVKYIKDSGAEIVLFDPLYKLMEGAENAVEDFKPILKWFDELAEATNAAILYVHHDKKGFVGEQDTADRGAGSSILGRDFDASFYLTPHENKELVVLQALTRNYAPREDTSVEWVNGCFVGSDEHVRIKTSRSAQKNQTRIEDWIEPAIQILTGVDCLGMDTFQAKLCESGATVRQMRAVIEALVASGRVEFEFRKAQKGQPSKFIKLSAFDKAEKAENPL